MPGSVRSYYKSYVDTITGFTTFHNQVINMPRDTFSRNYLHKLQVLASYLLLIKNDVASNGNNYKEIMGLISEACLKNIEHIKFRDINFENEYLKYRNLDVHYDEAGRMFRHLMGACAFWGMIKSISRQKKVIDFDRCMAFVVLEQEQISTFLENISLDINIKNNDLIKNLTGIETIRADANYHPTLAILKYMKEINRSVTDFELSILLGRIDSMQFENLILQRALDIGRWLTSTNRNGQQQQFFKEMGWVNNDKSLFTYRTSQEPWFKFQTYLIFLEAFGLISINRADETYSLTDHAKNLLGDLPASILDLNKIINDLDLDGGSVSDTTMKDVLIRANLDTLKTLVANQDLIKKINKLVISKPTMKGDKRARNQFIAELARIREDYKCQAGTNTFERPDGRNYVEAHHIIEFSKNGPDILDNLLVLGPTPHTQLHRGSEKAIQEMYRELMNRGAIQYKTFENMIDEYNVLTDEHLEFLYSKGVISTQQKTQLHTKIINNA
ncbi:MAG: HNH endonuclease [Lactobacillaceae bacterium]|jgi:hypothetical protein|nr:HNH endonuclease [Lactobacillaceae bacterium]